MNAFCNFFIHVYILYFFTVTASKCVMFNWQKKTPSNQWKTSFLYLWEFYLFNLKLPWWPLEQYYITFYISKYELFRFLFVVVSR